MNFLEGYTLGQEIISWTLEVVGNHNLFSPSLILQRCSQVYTGLWEIPLL